MAVSAPLVCTKTMLNPQRSATECESPSHAAQSPVTFPKGGRNSRRVVVLTAVALLGAATAVADDVPTADSDDGTVVEEAGSPAGETLPANSASDGSGAHRHEAEALLLQAERVVQEIAAVRGIEAQRPIPSEVQDRTTLGERIREMILREYPIEEIEADQRAMMVAGVLQPDDNLFDLTLGMLQENIAGYYDHDMQTFFILDDTPPEAQEMVMSHELFHALQDQEWGIELVRGPEDKLSDVTLARTALLEGDAVAVMLLHSVFPGVALNEIPFVEALLQQTSVQPAGGFQVPEMMWQQLAYPYSAGFSFILDLFEAGGWDAVNAAYLDPPDSTEQILHPEKYLTRDDPTWVEFSLRSHGHLEMYEDDIMGEFSSRAWLQQILTGRVTPTSIERVCAGWDGDRMRFFRSASEETHDVLVWAVTFDSTAEASAMRRVLPRVGEPLLGVEEYAGVIDGEPFEWMSTDIGSLRVEQRDETVVMVLEKSEGRSEEERRRYLQDLSDDVWNSLSLSAYPETVTERQEPALP
jgi:hypothetical protein